MAGAPLFPYIYIGAYGTCLKNHINSLADLYTFIYFEFACINSMAPYTANK